MIDKIKEKALAEHIPIIMDDTLEIVDKILKQIKPSRILEIGTAVGYSAICFSEYLEPGGKIDTIERDIDRKMPSFLDTKLFLYLNSYRWKQYSLGSLLIHSYKTLFSFLPI